MTTTLEQQIEALKAEHAFKSEMETLFGGYKYLAYCSKWKDSDNTISIDLRKENLSEIDLKLKDITNILKPTVMTYKSNDIISQSPFSFWFENGVNENYVMLGYISNRTAVRIEVPLKFYSNDIVDFRHRNVSDSEYHYFGGVSMNKIKDMRIPAYNLSIFKNKNYYGGNSLAYVLREDETEDFNFVALNGHTQEFKEFWQNQLTINTYDNENSRNTKSTK